MRNALIRLLTAVLATLLLVVTIVELDNRYRSAALVLTSDPIVVAEGLAQGQRWVEAQWIADFIGNHPHLGDADRAAVLSKAAQLELDGLGHTALRFAEGALTGEPADLASLMGSLSLDLFVVGDVRDIAVQSWKQLHYGTGDAIVLALSSVGLATSIVPEIDWAPAFLKWLKKSGALNVRLLSVMQIESRKALRTGDFKRLTAITENIGRVGMQLGPGPLRGALMSVETADDLATLARASKTNARDTYVLTALFGTQGIRRVQAQKGKVAHVVRGIKHGSRVAKIAKKALGAVSLPWLLLLVALSIVMYWWSLRGRRRRVSRKRHRIEPLLNTAAGPLSADVVHYGLGPKRGP